MQLRHATTQNGSHAEKRDDKPEATRPGTLAFKDRVEPPRHHVDPRPAGIRNTNAFHTLACMKCDARPACLIQSLYRASGDPSLLLNHQRSHDPGAHLFHAGEQADAIYMVSTGSVKAYVLMEDGEEQVTNFFLSGEVAGLDSIGSGRHISSAVTLEQTTVCKLPRSLLTKYPPGEDLLATFSRYLAHDHNMKLILAHKDADSRMASFLLDISHHYENLGQTSDVFTLTMTRQDIANYLGMAIETVSRTLRRFQDHGILEVTRRNICIEDFISLQNIAGKQVSP